MKGNSIFENILEKFRTLLEGSMIRLVDKELGDLGCCVWLLIFLLSVWVYKSYVSL